jgi:NADH-ubiquinone oxidoreductase chain 5
MYILPLLSTFLSSLFAGFMVSRGIGYRGVTIFSVFSLVVAFLSSATIWYEVVFCSCNVSIDVFGSWFEVGSFNVSWILHYDLLAAHMLFTVTSVSLAVHMFALVYMRSDPHLTLFMSYLSLFTFFMLVLVTSDNLLLMLVGWEGSLFCPNDDLLLVAAALFNGKVNEPWVSFKQPALALWPKGHKAGLIIPFTSLMSWAWRLSR